MIAKKKMWLVSNKTEKEKCALEFDPIYETNF